MLVCGYRISQLLKFRILLFEKLSKFKFSQFFSILSFWKGFDAETHIFGTIYKTENLQISSNMIGMTQVATFKFWVAHYIILDTSLPSVNVVLSDSTLVIRLKEIKSHTTFKGKLIMPKHIDGWEEKRPNCWI